MRFPAATKLNSYEIQEFLGAGGMGDVYRARDGRLQRDVALKVLPAEFARSPQRLARFEREARILAGLTHDNIGSIYGFESAGDTHFLVLEFVAGQTLADHMMAGPMPLHETLDIGRQMAAGLEAAHARGVIHRDLKPGNVKFTPDGRIKILDFGLAKALDDRSPGERLPEMDTITAAHTRIGVVLGTPPYMSPEQTRGRPVDQRCDIWSFACVLFECLTGSRPFDGETSSDVMARILEREPDWSALPATTPPGVRDLLERCLEKNPRQRQRDIGDVRLELERLLAGGEGSGSAGGRAAAPRRGRWTAGPWALAGLLTVAAGLTWWPDPRGAARAQAVTGVLHARVDDPQAPCAGLAETSVLDITRDGRELVYLGGNNDQYSLFARRLSELAARPLPVEESYDLMNPFLSPDGQWMGYYARGGLYKICLEGGPPVLLARLPGLMKGAVWTEQGIILCPSPNAGLARVSPDGGALEVLTVPDAQRDEVSHRWPDALPGGRHVLMTIKSSRISSFDEADIALLDLRSGQWKAIIAGGSCARWLPTGHVVYARGGELLGVALDLARGEVRGTPLPLVKGVMTDPGSGAAQFAVARDAGMLAYVPGGPNTPRRRLAWLDRSGRIAPTTAALRYYRGADLSPDGARVATTILGATDSVFTFDLARGVLSRTTEQGNCSGPVWMPDGRHLLYASDRGGQRGLFMCLADGTEEQPVAGLPPGRILQSVALPEGPALLTEQQGDIWLARLDRLDQPQRVIGSRFNEQEGVISPDGEWIAYSSDETGSREVYVSRFPQGQGKWSISVGGGDRPRWAPGGDEIVYAKGHTLYSARISTAAGFVAQPPVELLTHPPNLGVHQFHPDGQRFIAIESLEPEFAGVEVRVILNWLPAVQRQVAAQGAGGPGGGAGGS